jgi:apolipoprotein N-acyltransferase
VGGALLGGDGATNSALLTERSGHVLGRYDKQRLIPWFEARLGGDSLGAAYRAGSAPYPLRCGELEVVPQICWDLAFRGAQWPRAPNPGLSVLGAMSSDDWTQSPLAAASLGLAARVRAAEQGLPAAFSTTRGGSFVAGARGELLAQVPRGASGVALAGVSAQPRPSADLALSGWFLGLFASVLLGLPRQKLRLVRFARKIPHVFSPNAIRRAP